MSKHKRLHSMGGKGGYSKFAGFVSSHYPPPKKVCHTSEDKKTARSAADTTDGKETPHSS